MLAVICSVSSSPRSATSASFGTGITAGRPSALPSAFENSRLVTGFGRGRVERPRDALVVERPEQQPDLVVAVDPRHVLAPAGERPADAELERQQQLLQQARPRGRGPGPCAAITTRTPPVGLASAAASQSTHTWASKSSPGGVDSSTIASPRSP